MAAPWQADGFVSRYVSGAGPRLHVRERIGSGEPGPAWVLLHGLAVSHRYLMPTALALTGARVLVPDLPGFGRSQKTRLAYDVGRHTEVIAAWLDAEGISGAYLLGNSFGCQIAVELAVRRPDLVAALVLVGPTVDPAAPTAAGQAWRWCRDLAGEDPKQARIIAADVRDAGPGRVLRTLRHSVRHHIGERLPLVEAPVLVLRGEHDVIAPRRWVARAASLARDGHAGEIPDAAHNAVTTAGPLVAARSQAFVAAVGTVCQ
jgi:pimeloyl-ACP methyl ester carboxylesterase